MDAGDHERGELTGRVLARCRELGFALAGIAPAAESGRAGALREWLRAGKHGTMGYLAEHEAVKADPRRLMAGVRAFVMVADAYAARGAATESQAESPGASLAGGRGRIARYARGKDYHDVMRTRLKRLRGELWRDHPGAGFRVFVDNTPVMERELAVLAGLGWQAKNTLLINPRLGSYVLLGGLATTLDLAPTDSGAIESDHCGTCTRCIDACPTGAIAPYSVDARRCVSYLTIEREGVVDPALREGVGSWIYGCDVCQEVCPHNSARVDADGGDGGGSGGSIREAYRARRETLDLLEVLAWDEAARAAAFRGSAMKRVSLDMIRRNAVIVAGNAMAGGSLPALRAAVERIAGDPGEPALVRDAARDALAR